jgi:hypothetical protein
MSSCYANQSIQAILGSVVFLQGCLQIAISAANGNVKGICFNAVGMDATRVSPYPSCHTHAPDLLECNASAMLTHRVETMTACWNKRFADAK